MTIEKRTEHKANKPLLFKNGAMAIAERIEDFDTKNNAHIDGVLIILCCQGEVKLDVSGHAYTIRPNDLLICMPEVIIENGEICEDLEFKAMFMSVDYAFNLLPISVRNWNFKMFFEQNPQIHLTDKEVSMFNRYFDLLKEKFADTSNPYREYVVNALVEALAYDFHNVFDHLLQTKPHPISSGENIFDKFIELLSTAYPKRRSVAYYANWLNITPKYLSVVCKKIGGHNASKIIDNYVSKDIERLLRNSRKSVKEISVELDFPNTSFFGRYVKKNFGCTPNELRRKLNGLEERSSNEGNILGASK